MQSYLLFLDTETSGKPKKWNASPGEQWPYVVQLAWIICDRDGNEIKRENHYIYDKAIRMDPDSEKIHGISESFLLENGNKRVKVIKKLYKDLLTYQPLLIGHLLLFDIKMLSSAFKRAGIKNILPDYPKFCTMTATSNYIRFQDSKYPKLDELYQSLFKEKIDGNHNALADAQATAACFFELVRRKEIDSNAIAAQQSLFKEKEKEKVKTGCGLPVLALLCIALFFIIIIL